MSLPLSGMVCLVTGASRGVGAATAIKLASLGSDLVVNYRSKGSRADEVVATIERLGRRAIAVQADLTNNTEVESMMAAIQQAFQRLDVLVLNASGGLEKGKAEEYAMSLNHSAQLHTAKLATILMCNGGRIVFVTTHWAPFYGQKPVVAGYEVVAKSKHAGEHALRDYASTLSGSDISLVVVSGDVIEGTITPRLLERKNPGLLEYRRNETGALPTIEEFANVIASAASDKSVSSGHTIFVGSIDY
jgi:3-oxoacyl-[acyl-carrier protein] reductase